MDNKNRPQMTSSSSLNKNTETTRGLRITVQRLNVVEMFHQHIVIPVSTGKMLQSGMVNVAISRSH